jgi:hypothetical protein
MPNDSDERKLWFEYIKTLNERQLQKSQRSGITTYVLLATLIGLLYRFGPQIPQFLGQADKVRAGVTIFVLLTVAVGSFYLAVAAVEMFCAGEDDFRAMPKSAETLIRLFYGSFPFVGVAFICLEVWIAISSFPQTKFTKYLLFTHALWLATNIVFPLVSYRRLAKKAKDIRNPLPRFSPLRFPRWGFLSSVAWTFIWSALGTVSLERYLRTLPGYGLQPFKAAGISLIAVVIVGYMIARSVRNATQQQHFGLERDIVLNRMTPEEIREKYLRDLSGPDMAQWLDEALMTLDRKEEHLHGELDLARGKVKEISAISTAYQAERKERATLAINNLRKALQDCAYQYQMLTFQTDFFVKSYKTQEENEALRKRFTAWAEKYRAFEPKAAETTKVLDELTKLAG